VEERRLNDGDWPQGKIPDVLVELCRKYYPSICPSEDEGEWYELGWVAIIERAIHNAAITFIVKEYLED
jgi:hypothetical protein